MSDKSEIEAKVSNLPTCMCDEYYHNGHAPDCPVRQAYEALEARIAQLEGALHEIQFGELQCDYCQENMRIARAALAEIKSP